MIGLVINGALKGFGQLLSDGKLRKVLWMSLGLALAAVAVALVAAWFATDFLLVYYLSWFPDWLVGTADVVSALGVMGLMWIMFPAIVTGFAGMFLDGAARLVEQRHYPNETPGVEPPLWPSVANSLKFTAVVVAVNLALIPLYLIGFFFPPLLLLIFCINGWLMGREYFELVGYRHLPQGGVYDARRKNSTTVLLGGIAIAIGFTIPFVNLLVPVVGVAMMVHVFKGLQARGRMNAPVATGG
jgi:CysZ protein